MKFAAYFAIVLGVGLFMGKFVKNAGDFFAGYFAGALFGTAKLEAEEKTALFKKLS